MQLNKIHLQKKVSYMWLTEKWSLWHSGDLHRVCLCLLTVWCQRKNQNTVVCTATERKECKISKYEAYTVTCMGFFLSFSYNLWDFNKMLVVGCFNLSSSKGCIHFTLSLVVLDVDLGCKFLRASFPACLWCQQWYLALSVTTDSQRERREKHREKLLAIMLLRNKCKPVKPKNMIVFEGLQKYLSIPLTVYRG